MSRHPRRPLPIGRRTLTVLIAGTALTASAASFAAQEKTSEPAAGMREYVISGLHAWSAAKSSGFIFQPLPYASGQWVTDPRDGVDTRLLARAGGADGEQTLTLAQIAAGAASVNRPQTGSRTVVFDYFRDQSLRPPWTVTGVDVVGNFVWQRRPEPGSAILRFQIRASSRSESTGSATVRSITLRGPADANWESAFRARMP